MKLSRTYELRRMPFWMAAAAAVLLNSGLTIAATGFEHNALALINQQRELRNRTPLAMNPVLYRLAKAHSDQMAARNAISHNGFRDRYARSGFRRCVENVSAGQHSAESVVETWRGSPKHNANMLDSRLSAAGVARTGAYTTFLACGQS